MPAVTDTQPIDADSEPTVTPGGGAAAGSPSSGSSAAAEAAPPKTFLLTLFGTDDRIEIQANGKAQVHTLAIPMMGITGKPAAELKSDEIIPGITPNVNTLALAGPYTDASNVHQIIAKAALECLLQLGSGVNTIHINGHSRGACSAIYLSNVLAQVQKNILAAASSVPPQTLTVAQLFKGCNQYVVTAVTDLLKNERYSSVPTCSKEHFAELKLNIFAIDPVPGNMSGYKVGYGFWNDEELRTLPPLVKNYAQIEMMHENTWFFNSLVPKAENKNVTRRQIIRLPGNHCNPCGKLHFQQGAQTQQGAATDGVMLPPSVITQSIDTAQKALTKAISQNKAETVIKPLSEAVETAKAPLQALAAQHHLTIFHMLDAMRASGLEDIDASKICEEEPHTGWHGCLKPIKDLVKEYIAAETDQKDLLKLDCYNKLKAGEAFFNNHIARNYYPWVGGNRLALPFTTAYRETHKISGKNSARAFYSNHPFKSPQMGNFISMEHLVLHVKAEFNKDDDLRRHVTLVEALLKTKNRAANGSGAAGAFNLSTSELCANILKVVNAAVNHYTDGESQINSIIKSSTEIIISLLISKLMTPGLSINELKQLSVTLESLKNIMGAKVPVNVFNVHQLVFIEFNSKVDGSYFNINQIQTDIDSQFPTPDTSNPLHNIEKTVKHLELLNARYVELNHLKNVHRELNKQQNTDPRQAETLKTMQTKLDALADCIINTFTLNKQLFDEFLAEPMRIATKPAAEASAGAAAGESVDAEADEVSSSPAASGTRSPSPQTKLINTEVTNQICADVLRIRSLVKDIAKFNNTDLFNTLSVEDTARADQEKAKAKQCAEATLTAIQHDHQTELAEAHRHADAIISEASIARIKTALHYLQTHDAEIQSIKADILEHQNQIKIINIRAIKIGASIGLVVTAIVGGTLCLYLFAPAIVPVLLAQAILTTTGIGSMLTPLVAIKALVIATSAGLITGLGTKEVVSFCSKKPVLNVLKTESQNSNPEVNLELAEPSLPEVPDHEIQIHQQAPSAAA